MAVTKKGWKVIFILIGIGVALILLYAYRDKLFGKTIKDPNLNNEPVPQGSGNPKWVPEKFDLDLGMYGPMIAKMQKALGISDDGKFGNQTKSALQGKGYSVPLKKTDYDKIVKALTPSGENNVGKVAYAKIDGVKVYNADFSIYKTAKKDEWIGTVEGVEGDFYKTSGNRRVAIGSVRF